MSGKAEKLQDAIGMVSDEYVLEAHGDEEVKAQDAAAVLEMQPQQKRAKWNSRPLAIAACLVIVLGIGALTLGTMLTKPADLATESKTEAEGDMAALSSSTTEERYTVDAADSSSRTDGEAGAAAESSAYDSSTTGESYAPGQGRRWENYDYGAAYVLTAGEWNDNENWAFFTNLVNGGKMGFPSFGIDPRHRVKVTVVNGWGTKVRGEKVRLYDRSGNLLWCAQSDKDGVAYLFYSASATPDHVEASGATAAVQVDQPVVYEQQGRQGQQDQQQSTAGTATNCEITLTVSSGSRGASGLQVMFIVDTTGSMSDEIAYLQKDFASIASDVGGNGVEYSVNFYRDEGDAYVTKCNGFTSNVSTVQSLLNAEYADGGGDRPEAVAQILTEAITHNQEWRDDCNKIAFLIFDAPPHNGTDAAVEAAVKAAAEKGIRVVPVVASNAERDTEMFGRALAICTNGTYVFLTDDSGVGNSHLDPIVGDYTVELLHDTIVRLIQESR